MKRLLATFAIAWASAALAATTVPVQLLSPTGSTSGQVITSAGPTSPPAWASLAGSGALLSTNNLSDVASAPTSRTNLGLGTAATQNTGTSGSAVPLLSGTNAWSAAQTFSALITPSSTIGIGATATNDNAASTSFGYYTSASAGPNTVSTGVPLTLVGVSLAAGDWDVSCVGTFIPAGTTTATVYAVGVSTTAATFGAANSGARILFQNSFAAGVQEEFASPVVRISLASAGTAFCVGQANFITSTMTANGFIRARRPR